MFVDPIDALYDNSAKFRQEVEATGVKAVGRVEYVPTNWGGTSKAEERELLGGFDAERMCPVCHMALAKNGACTGFC